jgi:simple sugar transport system ATP-binding protein
MKYGIGMVHQEFMLIDGYNVAENIKLNRENLKKTPVSLIFGKRLNLVDRISMHRESKATLDSLGIELSDRTRVGSLPVGYKQFVEIARELDKKNIKLIVLDEPTAVLTESEAETFLSCVRAVAQKGIAFIFISHKLDEVKKNSNHIFILRDGELVGDYPTDKLSTVRMSELMVGREVEIQNRQVSEEKKEDQEICLELNHFRVSMPGEVARDISLQVHKGEIFGIGGLAGHGKISIANGIMGLYPSKGEVKIHGKSVDVSKTKEILDEGIAFVSEDRRGVGLMLDESIELNISIAALKTQNRFVVKKFGIPFYDKKAAVEYAKKMIQEMDIRCTGHDQLVKSLSGGNQQKVCIARALTLNPDILFVSEPTRGIDIGAKKMILDSLMKLNREKGVTIIITSSELAELRSICNRIAIVTEGKIAGILRSDDKDYKFGMLMSGTKPENVDEEAMGQ